MLILSWNEINKTGSFKHLLVDPDNLDDHINYLQEKHQEKFNVDHFNEQLISHFESTWESLNDQYIEKYDVSDNYRKILECKTNIALHKIDYYLRGNRAAKTYWKIEELILSDLLDDEVGAKFEDTVIGIEKHMKFSIDINTLTVSRYYDYINYINKAAA